MKSMVFPGTNIGKMRKQGDTVGLMSALKHSKPGVRCAAAEALRWLAAEHLQRIEIEPDMISPLIYLLDNDDADVRETFRAAMVRIIEKMTADEKGAQTEGE